VGREEIDREKEAANVNMDIESDWIYCNAVGSNGPELSFVRV
jgi:hypothetical protein